MCGRARLSSDVSEIKLVFRIPPAGGRWIRTLGPGTKEPVFVAEGELRDRTQAAKKGCFFMRYRWFESISLQRGVRCELDPTASVRAQHTGAEIAIAFIVSTFLKLCLV